jgi:hypothetical protein
MKIWAEKMNSLVERKESLAEDNMKKNEQAYV